METARAGNGSLTYPASGAFARRHVSRFRGWRGDSIYAPAPLDFHIHDDNPSDTESDVADQEDSRIEHEESEVSPRTRSKSVPAARRRQRQRQRHARQDAGTNTRSVSRRNEVSRTPERQGEGVFLDASQTLKDQENIQEEADRTSHSPVFARAINTTAHHTWTPVLDNTRNKRPPLPSFVLNPRSTNTPTSPSRSNIEASFSQPNGNEERPDSAPPVVVSQNRDRTIRPKPSSKSLAPTKDPARLSSNPQLIGQALTTASRDSSDEDKASSSGSDSSTGNEEARLEEEVARLEAETDRILAEQKKLDLERLRAQLAIIGTPPPPKARTTIIFQKITGFAKAKLSLPDTISQPGTPTSWTPTSYFPIDFVDDVKLASSPLPIEMAFIEHGGGGIVPQTDAPNSAINGGERRVTVRCLSSTINLPISLDTTPMDLIYSTANLTLHDIDPVNSTVMECYVVFGLERRLRRYEKIRDIMNSWDRDQQNSLLILPNDDSETRKGLDVSTFPKTDNSPPGFTVQIYHSSRPGKWSKRWVTLLDGGQMFSAKKPDARHSDKESISLCHLSDFDIYDPKDSEKRRHLKPPKKFCYAIKSQQKTNVFSNGENFIHFFCTDDARLADRFYKVVQSWRSWYLVNKKSDLSGTHKTKKGPDDGYGDAAGRNNHRVRASDERTPYIIGSLEPLVELERLDINALSVGRDKTFAVEPPVSASPPTSNPKPRTLATQTPPLRAPALAIPQVSQSEEEFSATGLLGDGYAKLKQSDQKGGNAFGKPVERDSPFTDGPSLLNQVTSPQSSISEKLDTVPWFPSAAEHSARARAEVAPKPVRRATITSNRGPGGSHRQGREKPHPLLDLRNSSPHHHSQPPQHRRDNYGHGIRAPTGAPLIDYATGRPEPNPYGPLSRPVPRNNGMPHGPPGMNRGPQPPGRREHGRPHTATSHGAGGGSISSGRGQPLLGRPHPPIPPLPDRSGRRPDTSRPREPRRGRDPRPQEPLVNLAR